VSVANPHAAATEPSRAELSGVAISALSVLVFAGSNSIAKLVMTSAPVSETLFVRCVVILLLLVPFLRMRDVLVTFMAGDIWLHVLRLVGATVDSASYYWAVTGMSLAGVSAIYLASPIYITAMSALFLGERVGWRRWAAVVVGFAGVVVALQPGGGTLSLHALVALLGSVFYSISIVATRRLRRVPNTMLVASQMAVLAAAAAAAGSGWIWPSPVQAGLMAAIGAIALLGFLTQNLGLKLARASVVAPLQYTSILWAGVLGFLMFGEVPGRATLLGTAVIVAAGGFILLREQRAPG
jgi:drug/metabolite transporter (DMT)-like permease